jgi:hypothetical protein
VLAHLQKKTRAWTHLMEQAQSLVLLLGHFQRKLQLWMRRLEQV